MKWIRRSQPQGEQLVREAPSAEDVLQQLDRVVGHPIFRKSENLCNILTFLVRQSLANPGVNHKEHEIATCALGRSDDFDPRLDSTVRVHTARLRTKLAEYYAGEGAGEPVVFEIPKGAYQLNVAYRDDSQLPAVEEGGEGGARAEVWRRIASPALWGWIAAAVAMSVALWLSMEARSRNLPPALGVLWSDFVRPGEENALVFSTPRFMGPVTEGLHFAPAGPVPPELLIEDYAGTGEVYGIGALAGFFGRYSQTIRIKRGRLLTWDDARQQNLIFVGGPNVNLHLGELPGLQRFRFDTTANGSFVRDSLINDAHSGAQERPTYGHSHRPYTIDHAVIALMRLVSNRRMLLLAGTTTMGTQAAVDFVVHEETARALLTALKVPLEPGAMPDFEALLRVKVSDGVPVHSQILAVHLRK
jgi:hypothetical protein